eukprot:COSAG02_NODE_26153_length_639_cov_1.566667_1_plen_41_part_01
MVALTAAGTASRMLQNTVPGGTCNVYDFNDSDSVDVADLLL